MPPDNSRDAAVEGRRRWWRISQTAAAQTAAKVVSGLCQLVLVPLLLSHLGADVFGWMMALYGITALISFADLGVVIALQQRLAEAWGHGDGEKLRLTHDCGAKILARLGLGWLLAGLPFAWWLGPRLLAAPASVSAAAQQCAWLCVMITVAAGVATSSGQRLALAVQAGWLPAAWTAGVNIMMLIGVIAATRMDAGPAVFLALLGAGLILPGVLSGLQLARRYGWTRTAKPTSESTINSRQLWREGLRFAPPHIAGAILQSAAAPAVVHFGGFGAGAAFALLMRLFGLITQAHATLLMPLWPAYAEAMVRKDLPWIERTFRLSLQISILCAAAPLLATAFLPAILTVWVGNPALVPMAAFAWFVAGWQAAGIMAQPFSTLLLGHDRLSYLAARVASIHVMTLIAMAGAGMAWGATGVAAALLGGTLLGLLPLVANETVTTLQHA